ncbi:hypothetical protein [Paenibacillus periandrae]|uniref:hypothetical protein n=1 Tax=Paenibacillus periandrae TaxID=1761741 RepID=UPI001F08FBF6|nr:hypothetical protein [Paenibacillus periandrae]
MSKICFKCNGSLFQLGSKLVCQNEQCDYVELASSKNWFEELGKDDNLWIQPIKEQTPYLIAIEYDKLHKLLVSGSTYGVQFQIKDMFEVLLKFPILILLSEVLESKKLKYEYQDVLTRLTGKPLSLGDWHQVALEIRKKSSTKNEPIFEILRDISGIYEKYQIVNWRNERIGHGALKLDNSTDFQNDIRKMLYLISEHLTRCQTYYVEV